MIDLNYYYRCVSLFSPYAWPSRLLILLRIVRIVFCFPPFGRATHRTRHDLDPQTRGYGKDHADQAGLKRWVSKWNTSSQAMCTWATWTLSSTMIVSLRSYRIVAFKLITSKRSSLIARDWPWFNVVHDRKYPSIRAQADTRQLAGKRRERKRSIIEWCRRRRRCRRTQSSRTPMARLVKIDLKNKPPWNKRRRWHSGV